MLHLLDNYSLVNVINTWDIAHLGCFICSLAFIARICWVRHRSANSAVFFYDGENMIKANLERLFVLESYILKPLTFCLLLVSGFWINLLFLNDLQKVLCPKNKDQSMPRLLMWLLLDALVVYACFVLTVFLYSVLFPCPLLCLSFLISCDLWAFSNKAPSVYLPVGWNNAWVSSDMWDVGHSIQGSGEDVSCLAKTPNLWSPSAFMDQRWKDSLVL